MGRKRTDKPKKKERNVAEQETRSVEEQSENLGYRMATLLSVGAGIAALLLLVFFFSSDIRGNIVASKVKHAYAAAQSSAPANSADSASGDLVSTLSDPEVSRADAVASLEQMSEEDFQDFVDLVTKKVDGENAGDTDTTMNALSDLLNQDDAIKKSDVIAFFEEMDATAFDTIMTALVMDAKKESNAQSKGSLQETLEDAYAEAEAKYPGQIDGSKRLKLVNDVNAIDYKYYVAEQGDTLIALSNAFEVPLGQLVELNGIHDADVIPAGMILLFPLDTEQPNIKPDDH